MTLNTIRQYHNQLWGYSELLQHIVILISRLYIANIFFSSGMTKLRDWDSTLMLFEYEYEVPLLSPVVAAWAGTIGELVLPILLATGLLTRISAMGLFIVNYVAVLSLVEIAPASHNQHILWGCLCALVALLGAKKLSLDHLFKIS